MFGKTISDIIEDSDRTQTEIAAALGVTTRQVMRWKNNQSEIPADKLKEFCKLMNVSADYILGIDK